MDRQTITGFILLLAVFALPLSASADTIWAQSNNLTDGADGFTEFRMDVLGECGVEPAGNIRRTDFSFKLSEDSPNTGTFRLEWHRYSTSTNNLTLYATSSEVSVEKQGSQQWVEFVHEEIDLDQDCGATVDGEVWTLAVQRTDGDSIPIQGGADFDAATRFRCDDDLGSGACGSVVDTAFQMHDSTQGSQTQAFQYEIPTTTEDAAAFLSTTTQQTLLGNIFQSWFSTFRDKVPFAWFVQLREEANRIEGLEASQQIPTARLEVGSSTDMVHVEATVFSTSTINTFVNPQSGWYAAFYTLMQITIWLTVFFTIYRGTMHALRRNKKDD